MIETIHNPDLEQTALIVWKDQRPMVTTTHQKSAHQKVTPVSAKNNLIKHRVLLFPSFIYDYGNERDLIDDVRAFIHQYCDLGNEFEIITTYYVFLTWVYDRFRELPYLRLQGDFGTGKSRFLQVVGSLCYKPIFASGASTISPIFHALNTFRGTLIMDEADFRFSDEKADVVKILNNGNMKGFPLLRSEVSKAGIYNPKAFHVFGPKILATRGAYQDPALESRIITRRAKSGNIRKDIPLTLPDTFEEEAQKLRNQLLMWRFKNWRQINMSTPISDLRTGERIAQVFKPLLTVTKDKKAREIIRRYAAVSDMALQSARAYSVEEYLLVIMGKLIKKGQTPLSIKQISSSYRSKYRGDHTGPVTNKWIGGIVRNRLHLSTVKRNGVYIIPETEQPRLKALFQRYNIDAI